MTKKGKFPPPPPAGQEDAVGYGRPPVEHRFKPGQSGNAKGRPKGAKTRKSGQKDEQLKDIILQEVYREVPVQDGQKALSMSVAQATVRSLSIRAAKGDIRAAKLLLELIQKVETARREDRELWLKTAIGYKVDWEKELQRRKVLAITHLPDPLPHPDDIIVDFANDTVSIVGPMTKEEKTLYDGVRQFRKDAEKDLRYSLEELETATDPDVRKLLEEDVARGRRLVALLDKKLGAG